MAWLKLRRLELLVGLTMLLVYAWSFPELYQTFSIHLMLLALPGLALVSWGLGLWGAALVGLLNIPVQVLLLDLGGAQWDTGLREIVHLMTGVGLAASLALGLFRFQYDRRQAAELAMRKSQAQTEHRQPRAEPLLQGARWTGPRPRPPGPDARGGRHPARTSAL